MLNGQPLYTANKFGTILQQGPGPRGKFLQPKVKWKWRVIFEGFGPGVYQTDVTRQLVTTAKPTVAHPDVAMHSYNSVAYYAGKHEWQPIEMVMRDDVSNTVKRMVDYQLQKQMNHYEQTTFRSAVNYKFNATIITLDGGNDAELEKWHLEGCFLTNVNYDQLDYSSNDPVQITMSVRYDNATCYAPEGNGFADVNNPRRSFDTAFNNPMAQ